MLNLLFYAAIIFLAWPLDEWRFFALIIVVVLMIAMGEHS